MAFPHYWFAGVLTSMGWPRQEGGFLRKTWVVDSSLADRMLDLLNDTAILIGALSPKIGTSILVSQLNESDWTDKNVLENYTSMFEKASNLSSLQGDTDLFRSVTSKVPWEDLGKESVSYGITTHFIGALWLGLTKPQQMAERINNIGRSQNEDELFIAGLMGAAQHSKEEMLQAALEIVSTYETTREKHKNPPALLLNYINELRSSEKS